MCTADVNLWLLKLLPWSYTTSTGAHRKAHKQALRTKCKCVGCITGTSPSPGPAPLPDGLSALDI